MKTKLISQAEYARQKGVSAPRINHLVKSGIIKLKNGKVDPKQADAAIEGVADPARDEHRKMKGRPVDKGTGTGSPYRQAVTAERFWKARLAQLEVKQREGELVDAVEVQDAYINLIIVCKTRLRAIPAKTATQIAYLKMSKKGQAVQASIQTLLLKEIDEALTELSRYKSPKPKKRSK